MRPGGGSGPPEPRPTNPLIEAVIRDVNRKFGSGAVTRLSESYEAVAGVIPLGLPSVERALDCGGWPLGKMVELWGPESVGKTTFCKFLASRAQAVGATVLYIDQEGSIGIDAEFDRALGLDPTSLLLAAPPEVRTMEQCFGVMLTTVRALRERGGLGLILFDSIAATRLQAELERPLDDDARPGVRAAFLSVRLGQLLQDLKGAQIGVVFVNQERDRLGALPFQPKTGSPGGHAFKHFCHLRIQMRRIKQLKEGSDIIGQLSRLKVEKSKIGPPLREATIRLLFRGQVDDAPDDADAV